MKKLLLTGAHGFIGSYFQKEYAHKYVIQTFSFLKDNIETLHVKGIETVIHLSALVHQMDGASDEAYDRVNVEQTVQLARKAKENHVKQFIFMSTVKVYGEENDVAYTEASPCHPEDAYGRSKLKAEQELQALVDEDFTVSIIRTPIVYGRGVKANMQNLMKLVDSMPLLPLGGIDNKRSFVYVGNVCALLDSLIEHEKEGVFLAGDDVPLSTTELIQELAKAKKKKLFLIQLPLFAMFLKWVKPSFYKRLFESLTVDTSHTQEVLQFKNPYSTQEGIAMMIQGTVQ